VTATAPAPDSPQVRPSVHENGSCTSAVGPCVLIESGWVGRARGRRCAPPSGSRDLDERLCDSRPGRARITRSPQSCGRHRRSTALPWPGRRPVGTAAPLPGGSGGGVCVCTVSPLGHVMTTWSFSQWSRVPFRSRGAQLFFLLSCGGRDSCSWSGGLAWPWLPPAGRTSPLPPRRRGGARPGDVSRDDGPW